MQLFGASRMICVWRILWCPLTVFPNSLPILEISSKLKHHVVMQLAFILAVPSRNVMPP